MHCVTTWVYAISIVEIHSNSIAHWKYRTETEKYSSGNRKLKLFCCCHLFELMLSATCHNFSSNQSACPIPCLQSHSLLVFAFCRLKQKLSFCENQMAEVWSLEFHFLSNLLSRCLAQTGEAMNVRICYRNVHFRLDNNNNKKRAQIRHQFLVSGNKTKYANWKMCN